MTEGNVRRGVRYTLAAVFLLDGVLHVAFPAPFIGITPPWVPDPALAVLATGIAAFAGGLGLLIPRTRRWAGMGLALYCVAVYPANVHHALAHVALQGKTLGWGYHGPRLLLQPVFTWACLWAAGVIDWPFRRTR
jgi:uncharacterized membrane protein